MPADFPSSPTLNQTYTFAGRTWKWNGTGWQLVANATDTLTLTNGLLVPAANASAPSVRFGDDTNTGIYSPGADQLAISTGGTNRVLVDAAGKVGIGTAGPNVRLEVTAPSSGRQYSTSVFDFSNVHLDGLTPGSATSALTFSSGGGGGAAIALSRGSSYDTSISFWTNPSGTAVANAATQRMTIDPSGRVGIGATSPTQLLHLASSSTSSTQIALENTTGSTWNLISTGSAASIGGDKFSIYDATNTAHRLVVDSSGRLLVGTSSAVNNLDWNGTSFTPRLQVVGANNNDGSLAVVRTETSPWFFFGAGASGTNVATGATGTLGTIAFTGYHTDKYYSGATISAQVDGTPGANDMPGRLVFATTADGAASATEQMRITNGGVVAYNQATPISKSAAATLTVAELQNAIINYTGAAATLTLPTGTLTEAGFSGVYTNLTFEWSVINTGSGTCTIGAGAGHTITGSATIAVGASGRFASRRTAANTFVSYRLA